MSKSKSKLIKSILDNYRPIENSGIFRNSINGFKDKDKIEQERILIEHAIWLSPWNISKLKEMNTRILLAHIGAVLAFHIFPNTLVELDGEFIKKWSGDNKDLLKYCSRKNKINYLKYQRKKNKISQEEYLKELIKCQSQLRN